MTDKPLNDIIETSLTKIRSVADSNTVIGEPIKINDSVTVLPFSKVSVGFAAGGADYVSKKAADSDKCNFAGGNGAGVSVTPLGFIIINGTDVQVIDLKAPVAAAEKAADNPVSKAFEGINTIIDKLPELIAKIKGKKKETSTETDDSAE